MRQRGRLITFEGGEGAGKSTQVRRLAETLARAGVDVLTTREPGGTPGAEAIRGLLVSGPVERWSPLTEVLLHLAARHDHVVREIAPALTAGRWVLCDRFADSTRVYQGLAGGVGLDLVDRLHQAILGQLDPDLTFIMDLPVDRGLSRHQSAAGQDRYERMGQSFHEAVRAGFLEIARRAPKRCKVIDAAQSEDEVARTILETVASRFGLPLEGACG
jgi:dTMP kinase